MCYNTMKVVDQKLSKNAIVHQLVDVSAGALGTSNTI